MEMATEKQLLFIRDICNSLNINFYGSTKIDASKFINANIERFKQNEKLKSINNYNCVNNVQVFRLL